MFHRVWAHQLGGSWSGHVAHVTAKVEGCEASVDVHGLVCSCCGFVDVNRVLNDRGPALGTDNRPGTTWTTWKELSKATNGTWFYK